MARGALSKLCAWHGKQIASCPLVFILFPAFVVAVLAAGIAIGLNIDTDANKIWVPPDSTTAQQKQFFDAAFDPFYRVNQVIVSIDDPDEVDPATGAAVGVLQPRYLQAVFDLQQRIVNGVSSTGTTLNDICFKPIPGKGCLIETPLDWWKSNGTVIAGLSVADVQNGIACRTVAGLSGIPCQSSIGVPVSADVVLGAARCPASPIPGFNASVCGSCGGTAATSLVLTFLLQATPQLTDAGAQWEQDVFLPAVSSFSSPGLRATYMAERSISDQLVTVDDQNQGTVILSYAAMFIYVALALGKTPHPVASRALLAMQGMVIVALSVEGSLGLAAWTGLHVTMICVEVVPFLILAIGVDNVFILTKAMDRAWAGPVRGWRGQRSSPRASGLPAREAFLHALAEVGPTITAAALAEVAAFAVGISTEIPALRQFCIIAAVAVAIDYFLQVTWFAAAALLDAQRQEAGRADCVPCLRLRRQDEGVPEGYEAVMQFDVSLGSDGRQTAPSRAILLDDASLGLGMAEDDQDGHGPRTVLGHDEGLQEGYGPKAQADRTSSGLWSTVNHGAYVKSVMTQYWAPLIMSGPARAVVLLAWVVMVGVSCYGAGQLPLGLEQQLVLPTGSYLVPYFTDQSRLGDAGPPMYVVLQNVNYSHPNASQGISDLASILASRLPDVLVPPVFSWVGDFETWGSDSNRALIASNPKWECPEPLDPSTAPLAARVAQFIYGVPVDSYCCQGQGFCGGQYASDIKFLWGVPKGANGSQVDGDMGTASVQVTGHAVVSKSGHAITVTATRPAPAGLRDGIDDGGCDLSLGYLSHKDVEGAVLASGTGGHGVGESLVVSARHLPGHFQSRLAEQAGLLGDAPVTLVPCHIMTSRLRGQHVPMRNQSDYIVYMQKVQAAVNTLQAALLPTVDLSVYGIDGYGPLQPGVNVSSGGAWNSSTSPAVPSDAYADDNGHMVWLPPAPGGAAFPYTLVYVYYEQYGYIRGVAVSSCMLALAAVFLATWAVTSVHVAVVTSGMVASVTICLVGWVWMLNPHGDIDPYGGGPYGVSINAVSVVNLVTATGLAVEFVVHIASAYFRNTKGKEDGAAGWFTKEARATRAERARRALVLMGSPVVTGITLTKLVGVLVLASAPSALFRLYYFRMYLGIIVLGAFHGLALLPALLAA